MNYSYKNQNEDKSCFLGENLIIAVGSVQHCPDVDPLFCDHDAPWGAHAAYPWDQGLQASILGTFSILRVLTLELVQADVHLKWGNKRTGLLNFGRSNMRFFLVWVMIILSLFKYHKANCCFVNLRQNKAFLGQWGWVGSTKALRSSAGEAEQHGSGEVCWPPWPATLHRN